MPELKINWKIVTALAPFVIGAFIWVVTLETRVSLLVSMNIPGARQDALNEIEDHQTAAVQTISRRESAALRTVEERGDEIAADIEGTVLASLASAVFGEWSEVARDDFLSLRPAETNGLVAVIGPPSVGTYPIEIRSGPTTDEMSVVAQLTSGTNPRASAIAPVRVNHFWTVDAPGNTGAVVLWMPVFAPDERE